MDIHHRFMCRIREASCVQSEQYETEHVVKESEQTEYAAEHCIGSSGEAAVGADYKHCGRRQRCGFSVLAMAAGLLVALLPIHGYDQLLLSPMDHSLLNLSLLVDMQSFSFREYMLGSPLVLSTMLEMRCAPVCYSSQRVYNLSDLEPGDHIRHVGSVYAHHSLVDTVLNQSALLVVHFNDDRPNARKVSGYFPYFDKAIVLEQTLLLDPHVDVIELVVYDGYHTVEPKVDRLKVARSRLGNTDYGLLTNNCEAFMHELCVGLRYSRQAELISDLMQMVLYVPYLALLHFCHRRFGRTKSESKSDNVVFEMDEGPVLNDTGETKAGNDNSRSLHKHNSNQSNIICFYYGTIISNLCMALLLLILYAWYNTCLFLLHKFSVLSYYLYFPECY